jgi:hypothetical protein
LTFISLKFTSQIFEDFKFFIDIYFAQIHNDIAN